MNIKETATNGACLEDCRSNVFPLTDAKGLHWKKFTTANTESASRISEDPVLLSYSNAVQQGILCSWQGLTGLGDVKEEPESKLLDWGKELTLFWYGEEPQFSVFISPALREKENGCFDEGIPNEYQSLLFKSLHNLLERQLLSEKFFCNGKWFSKSCKKGCDWETLAFSFTFFIYGESLVAASVDIQKRPAVRCLSRSDLSDATSGDSVQVVLAPAGLNAALTGHSLISTDARAARILQEWSKFYPVVKDERSNGSIPCLVEIIHCDNKMLYPSCLVGVPVARTGKRLSDPVIQSEALLKDMKNGCSSCSAKVSISTSGLINGIWNKLEPKSDNKKSSNGTKPDTSFGPNKPLWDFKDRSRGTGCGCTSSTNVNRTKPLGRFGSNVSNLKGASGHLGTSSPSPSVGGTTPAPGVGQKGRKERKKTTLAFHQRRATNTERSPTPPITLPPNLKAMNMNIGAASGRPPGSEVTGEAQVTDRSTRNSPLPQNPIPSSSFGDKNLDQSYSSLQIQNISPNKQLNNKSQSSKQQLKYKSRIFANRKQDYSLPSDMAPKRPSLFFDALEARSSSTDSSYARLYVTPVADTELCTSEVVSPITLRSPHTKTGEAIDGEVKIVRMPNKGMKRTPEDSNTDDGIKKPKLASYGNMKKQQQANQGTPLPRSPAQPHSHTQQDNQYQPHPTNINHSHLSSQNQQQPQPAAPRRGPGRPKKQPSSSSLLSPKTEPNIFENGTILSPPLTDRRRRSSTQPVKIKEEGLASPPPISSIKAAPVKSRRRPSKKDHTPADTEMPHVTSPASRGNSVALSPAPFMPSPARTPGSSSGVSFTKSKDLMVNISDLDNLFDASDDEDDMDSSNKPTQMNPSSIDHHLNPRVSANDEVFRTTTLPSTSTGLPHDLAEMFPTPPSQEPQIHATSPATSVTGDYANPASVTTCHAVMSPEKHVTAFDKRYEEVRIVDGVEGLEPPFIVPKLQEHPVGDMFAPIATLPSMRMKKLKIKNPESLKYNSTWNNNNRSTGNSQEQAGSLLKLLNYDSYWRAQSKLIPTTNDGLAGSRTSDMRIANKRMPDGASKENIDMKTSINIEITNRLINEKEVIGNLITEIEEMDSLEMALICGDLSRRKNEIRQASPFDGLFTDDKPLLYNAQDDGVTSVFKEPRPMRPNTLPIAANAEAKNQTVARSQLSLSPRIAELFKEQWLSPFSILYLTKILSRFYKIDFKSSSQTTAPCPSAASGLLYELSPSIQNAFTTPLRRRPRDMHRIEGPVNFSSLHKLAGRNTLQSNLSVHPVLIGADGDYVSVAPNCLKSWKKLYLEPYAGPRDVAYVVVAPDSDLVLENTKQYFKELSIMYESMNLGKHGPIIRVLREGIIRVGLKVMQKLSNEIVDEWFSQDENPESIRMKLIAQVCKCLLGPHLASLDLNRTLFDKSAAEERSSAESVKAKGPGLGVNSISGLNGISSLGLVHEDSDNGSSNSDLPAIVVYMIDPFLPSEVSESKSPMWSLNGLIRAFAEMTSGFSDNLKSNVFLQVVPLESILQFKASTKHHNGTGLSPLDNQHLALSVYSSCRVTINSLHNGKICTGFGPGSLRDKLTKKRQAEQQFPTRVFVPPFILSSHTSLIREDPHTLNDLARVMSTGDYNILFCSYCFSNDQSSLLVSCTDRRGEISDATIIKIHAHNRRPRESRSPRKMALRRVLNFALDTISFFFETWRIVVHRLGKPGRGELKDLYDLSRKLISPNQPKKRPSTPENCVGCRSTTEDKQRPTIRSITISSIHLQSSIQIFPSSAKKKSNTGSRIFVVPATSQSSTKRKEKRMLPPTSLSLPLSQSDELLVDALFPLSNPDDEEPFMPLLPSPAEVSISAMLTSPHPDLVQPVFSPGDGMISPHLASQIPAMSPFQPIVQNSPAFSALSPLSMMHRPSSTPAVRLNASDEFTKISRQPLCIGYIISGSESFGDETSCPPVIKSDLLFHMARNDGQLSKHPLDSENYLELHRFVLEQLDGLSWLTIDISTGKRHSALASHIYLLTKFYETFNHFIT